MKIIFRLGLLIAWTVFWVHVWNAVGPAPLDPSPAANDADLLRWGISFILFALTWAFLAGPIVWGRGHST